MKKLLFTLALLTSFQGISQVKFENMVMENGLRYPKVIINKNTNAQDSINKIIEASLDDIRSSDFCAGDFGYIQKGTFLQILIFCNCIDMDESEHRYLFFDTQEGKLVPEYEIFDAKQREAALKYIIKRISEHKSVSDACNTSYIALGEDSTFDDMNIRLAADGIEIRPTDISECEKHALLIRWKDLQSYLKLNFI